MTSRKPSSRPPWKPTTVVIRALAGKKLGQATESEQAFSRHPRCSGCWLRCRPVMHDAQTVKKARISQECRKQQRVYRRSPPWTRYRVSPRPLRHCICRICSWGCDAVRLVPALEAAKVCLGWRVGTVGKVGTVSSEPGCCHGRWCAITDGRSACLGHSSAVCGPL